MKSKVGSKISFQIIRGGKKIYEDELHNVISNAAVEANTIWGLSQFSSPSIYTYTEKISTVFDGEWQQSGTTLSRVSGTDDAAALNDLYVFADGTRAGYRTAGSGSSITVSTNQTVSAQNLRVFRTGTAGGGYAGGFVAAYSQGVDNIAPVYAAGRLTWTKTQPQWSTTAATSDYTLARIAIITSSYGYFHYDLATPVSILIGDIIVVNEFQCVLTPDTVAPRILPTCPITGITTSCVLQRLSPLTSYYEASVIVKMHLITTPNKYTIGDIPTSPVSIASITSALSLTGAYTNTSPSASNDMTRTTTLIAATPSETLDVKQIMWSTTSNMAGVIEFDTPQTIAANKAIYISTQMQLMIDAAY